MGQECNKLFSDEMNTTATQYWQQLQQVWPQSEHLLESQQSSLKWVFGLSDFVATQLIRHPHWIEWLFAGALEHVDRALFFQDLKAKLATVTDEEQVKRILRDYRNKQLVCLAWREFSGRVSTEASLLDISALAEALIISARDWLYQQLCQQLGTPTDRKGNPQPLLILGMGKLGGRELNFSSDIDLIFTFPEHGETQGGRRSLENQQFFIRMGQRLVNLLDQHTVDGFVYRVDMRLRPYGDSGPLVVSFNGLEDYYQQQGRDWERYAMVKARILGEEIGYNEALKDMLRPFIYRRYIDFSAIDALRKMKLLIAQEVRRRKLVDNIKLGAGGIREVEFVVQSFQLIRGGRERALREQSLFAALQTLVDIGQIDYKSAADLKHNYCFLRRLENCLQAIDDKQTQTLPNNSLDWQRLAVMFDIADIEQFKQQISQVMAQNHVQFQETIGGEESLDNKHDDLAQLWFAFDDEDGLSIVKQYNANESLWHAVKDWRVHLRQRTIGPRGRDKIDKLMPTLLSEVSQHRTPYKAFSSILKVLDKILTRTTYLELLCENPGARQQLVSLCSVSPWIATQLARFPMLLDELIDPSHLYDTTSLDDYPSELRQYLLRIPEDDVEQQMEGLRQFKLSQQLKIAAADVTGVLPIMQVSDHLTFLAEAIIEQVINQAWQHVSKRHGVPPYLEGDQKGFAVIAYGKAGGLELGYGSDLDLVFLHNSQSNVQTNGERPIETGHFYLKLAQRILHLFSTRTVSGELYEVDMRLRPSGSSGLMVSEINRFDEYQRVEAWTWEHQALVRARMVFGDNALATKFNDTRDQVLCQHRDNAELKQTVHEMRLKMRQHLLKANSEFFDLKQGVGGITDIEFIVQYMVLAHAEQYHELTTWSDNVRILAQLAELELLPMQQAQLLTQAYCFLRDESHRLTLKDKPTLVAIDDPKTQAYAVPVKQIYQQVFDLTSI